VIKLSWKRWLKPKYVWMRIKRRFGWRPEWEKRIMAQKLQPERIIMSEELYNDLVEWIDTPMMAQPTDVPVESPEAIPDSINLKFKVK